MKKLFTLLILLVGIFSFARADEGTIVSKSSNEVASGNTPNYYVEQEGVGRLLIDQTGSKPWTLKSDGSLGTGSSMFALQTYHDIKAIKINATGTGNNRTFKTLQVCVNDNTLKSYQSVDATGEGTINSSQQGTITITPKDIIEAYSYVSIVLSGNLNIYSVTLVYADDPTAPSIKAADASIQATESGVAATQEIEITGKNLEGTTLTATLNPEVDGLSVKLNNSAIQGGEISTTATLTYFAYANTDGTTTLTLSDGNISKDITITYSSTVGTLFHWQSNGSSISTGTGNSVKTKGGTLTVFGSSLSNSSANYVEGVPNDMKSTASNANTIGSNSVYVQLDLDEALQEGDIINICGYNPYKIGTTKAGSTEIAESLDTGQDNKTYAVGMTTVSAEQAGANTLYLARAKGSGTGLAAIKIVRPAPSSDPVIKAADASIEATESGVAATQEIEITGKNLEGTTLTATLNPEVDGLSVELNNPAIQGGEISTTATLTYLATANASGTTTLTLSDGTTSKDVKIEYTAAVEPLVALSATGGKIELKSYETTVQGDTKVTLTGSKLKNGTYNVVADEAVTVTPAEFTVADGNVSQEFTVTTSVSTAATYQITFGNNDLGVEPPVYTFELIRPAKRDLLQSEVTEETTWDWSKAGTKEIKLDGTTDPIKNTDILLASIPEINNNQNFNSQALVVNAEYLVRDSKYIQTNSIMFKTTVPGTVEVTFSNTGSRNEADLAERRHIYIQGKDSGVYSTVSNSTTTASLNVTSGEVVINSFDEQAQPEAKMVRIYKIVFTPIELPSVTISSTGLTTFSSSYGHNFADVEGLGAFIVTEVTDNKVTLEEVTTVPEGTGLILCGAIDGVYTLPIANVETTPENPVTYAIAADNKIETNLLKAVLEQTTIAQGQGFVLDGDKPANHKFVLVDQETTLEAGTAYLPKENANIDAAEVPISNDPTGIENILIDRIDGMNDGFIYDLYGRRVDKISKGIYIINGKKILVK